MKGNLAFTASTSTHFGCACDPHFMDFIGKSNSTNAYIIKLYNDTSWILDIGATDHMSYNKTLFISFEWLHKCMLVSFIDGTTVQGSHSRHVNLFNALL